MLNKLPLILVFCAFGIANTTQSATATEVITCKDFGIEVEMILEKCVGDESLCSGTANLRGGGEEYSKDLKYSPEPILYSTHIYIKDFFTEEGYVSTEYNRELGEWYLPDGRWTNKCTRVVR